MEIRETMCGFLILDSPAPFDHGGVVHDNLIGHLFRERRVFMPHLLYLAMKPSWKKIELGVLKTKTVAPLGDPTFTQDHALSSVSEGITDESPFFESDGHEERRNRKTEI